MMRLRAKLSWVAAIWLAAAPAQAAQDLTEPPACGARIFVAMGVNQNYPTREAMRVPRGDLYLNDRLVGTISKNPEMVIIDVPAGVSDISWVPSSYDEATRDKTKRNPLSLTLGEKDTAFVVLDWYDDKPNATTVGYRTEAVSRDRSGFVGKRVAYLHPLPTPCATLQAAAVAPAEPAPKAAPAKTSPPAVAQSQDPQPDASEAFMASLQYYYVVNARGGAPVFASIGGDVTPLYTFPDKAELKVVDVSADRRWLTVTIPGGNRTGYVSAALVTSGARAPK